MSKDEINRIKPCNHNGNFHCPNVEGFSSLTTNAAFAVTLAVPGGYPFTVSGPALYSLQFEKQPETMRYDQLK